ncbi:FxsA family protein [Bacillus glycinifermentans]|uniref:Exlusion protein FxsA n=1 Tax=Bacillus glycinifermentans TaxID=1664069 RepID=A0A0T6BSX9_9BACI|nr:FxsA family protein [Bacillus glycinifermentans]ATH92757.1 membrane protein FxsA [Bacillus glycinifermentans]KRT94735.1 exlusion protein FxsA [Bacillus glycinifermentans]MEC0485584.1 membrane protein FxsA [Bacillus glycinifermentans]MEC0493530.1 membrane protein FxsA [Bacillus glycinifermentans]MEC0541737.1 membrane protein FxsA [Bacillus glycinifermentans]
MKFFLLFLIIFPACEIGLFLFSAKSIGVLPTVLLIILTGFLGAALAKKQGIEIYHKVQRDLQYGKMPGDAMLDGLCIFVGGMLLLLPGFLSDMIGLLLLLPLTRNRLKPFLSRRLKKMSEGRRIKIIK